jgi:DNA (cytosine-5)-methyltransferase 1
LQSYTVRNVGANKGAPRIYLDVHGMKTAGFAPGKTYNRIVNAETKRITLTVATNGSHLVSQKIRNGKVIPIIDINSLQALQPFEGMSAVRIVVDVNTIHILPLASESKRLERLKQLKRNLDKGEVTTAGVSFGGGVLDHAAHNGLQDVGINAKLSLAIEIDEPLLQHASEHNDIWNTATIALAAPMQELVQDDAAMRRLPTVDVLAMGIPCSGASVAGKSKRGLSMMESHPEIGHLVASAIMLISRIQPGVIVVENVPQYEQTASAQILRSHLCDMGYGVQETTLSANDFGCIENRVRWFMVAATRGITIDLQNLAPPVRPVHKLSEYLEDIGPDADDWRSFDYLKVKEARDAAKGSSFTMQIVTPESTSCPVLRKGYAKGGSTDPLLAHPTDPDLLRQVTILEHARIKQVPESLVDGLNKTDGHILLGQGIAYGPVKALFKRIGENLLQWRDQVAAGATQTIAYSLLKATG